MAFIERLSVSWRTEPFLAGREPPDRKQVAELVLSLPRRHRDPGAPTAGSTWGRYFAPSRFSAPTCPLIAEGHTNKEIAKLLNSHRATEMQRATLMRRLNVSSSAGLVRYAIRNKLVEP
jgi:hypothetical protein